MAAPSPLQALLAESPLALLQLDGAGRCGALTPRAAQLLAPGQPGSDVPAALHALIAAQLPQLAELLRTDSDDLVCFEALPLLVPACSGAASALGLSLLRIDDEAWLGYLAPADTGLPAGGRDPLLAALAAVVQAVWQGSRARLRREQAEAVRLTALLQYAGDAAIAMNLDGSITLWNRAAETLFGYPAAHALGRPLAELTLTPEHAHEDQRLFVSAMRGQTTAPFETLRRRSDGSDVEVEISAGPIVDADGRVVGVSKTLRNIAERRQAARKLQAFNEELTLQVAERTEQLARSSADLRTVLDALPSMVGSWDRQLVNRFANQAYARWFGRTPQELAGRHISEFLNSALYEKNRPHIEAVLRGEAQTFEHRVPDPDGGGMRYSLTQYVPDVVAGVVRGFHVVVHDIGAVKRAQQALSDSESLLQRVGRIAQMGGWWVELQTGAMHWSEQTRAIHEVDADFVPTAAAAIDFYAPQARPLIVQAAVLAQRGGPGWDLELPFITATGRQIWVRSMGEVEFSGSGEQRKPVRLVGACQDITARHEADRALEAAMQAAESANRAKGEFLANMSHEIRTPLNAIIGLGYMLEQQALPDEQRRMVAQIQTAGRSLIGVVNDVLDLSKIDAGQLELDEAPFALPALLDDDVQMLAASAAAKGLALRLQLAADVPAVVVGDAAKLTQMLNNLIGNAIKFTQHGSVELRVETAFDVQTQTQALRLSVTDTGPGISASVQQRLFQPFMQADASTSRQFGGTGLGLSIVARLARLMGGSVTLRSAPGEGSTFSLLLPLRAADADEQQAAEGRSAKLRVLVADDDPLQCEHLAALAASLGWRAQVVDGGLALVDRVLDAERQGQRYDALIVDWQMPDMDGLSALAELHRRLGDARAPAAVVVSAQDIVRLHGAAHAELAASILVKPVSSSTLFNAVNSAVASNESAHDRVLQSTLVGNGASMWLSGVRVLVADDSSMNLDVARHLLEHEGAVVSCCNDGQEVLERLSAAAPDFDAVLLDVQMPGMDGLEAARRIRQQLGLTELPLIALTAGVLFHERDRALASGMSDFLGKPLEPRRLIRTLRRHVERYRHAELKVVASAHAATTQSVPAPPLPALDGIDAALVPASLRAERGLYLSMLRRFVDEFGDAFGSTLSLPAGKPATPDVPADADARTRLAARVHKLRGSALLLGATALAQCAAQLDECLRLDAGAHDEAAALLARLAGALRQLCAGAEAVLAEEARTSLVESPTPAVALEREALLHFATLVERQSLDALGAFDGLAPALQSQLPAPAFATLGAAIRELDFARAAAVIATLTV